jgi:predicted dehydrogenase
MTDKLNQLTASRRQTLKTLAILGSAAAISPNLLANRKNDGKKLGVALVGLGNYSTLQLGPALRQTEHCELRGIVTGTPEKAVKWQKEYGILPEHTYNYDTYDRLKDDPVIDIVYVVLPNFMHADYTIRALEMGKHVICEKPMGMDAAECKAMIAAAEKAGRHLQVGYRLFYEPHHLEMQRWAQEPHEGRIRLMETSLGFDMARPGLWRIDKKMGGGGALMDLGPYVIQAARRAAGLLPTNVIAHGFVDDPALYQGIFGTYTWLLRFPDNTVCNSTASFSAYVDRYHVAKGNDFREMTPAFAANAKLSLRNWDEKKSLPAAEFQQQVQMDAFAENIMDETPVVASGREGLIEMQIIDAIKLSIETGKEVTLNYD